MALELLNCKLVEIAWHCIARAAEQDVARTLPFDELRNGERGCHWVTNIGCCIVALAANL
jgi:hypothetical protein